VLLQAALNGPFGKDEHPAMPVSVAELARDAAACVAAGAGAIHLHPRDADGFERLDGAVINGVAAFVRDACRAPVGVSTGAWIEPDLERRCALIATWGEPDYASVNVSEPGFDAIMRALMEAGVGIEAGVWSVEDAERLASSGLGGRVTRVLVEPVDAGADAIAIVDAIHRALDEHDIGAPRLQHGDGAAAWTLLQDAAARGVDTRIGLEDTLLGPDGRLGSGNEALVRAARALLQSL
jgi:uncharacterized protein (DUF849 family)